jgi:hypothetical protein
VLLDEMVSCALIGAPFYTFLLPLCGIGSKRSTTLEQSAPGSGNREQ